MKQLLFVAALFVCTAPLSASSRQKAARKLPIVVLEGTPHERGLTHGKTLKTQIHEVVKRWKANLQKSFKMDPEAFIKRFVQKTEYVAAIKKWTPDLLDEIRGIAEGAELDFDTIFVFQLIDEVWVQGEAVVREKCSSLGLGKNGPEPAMVAQTMDVETYCDGFQAVLHVKQPDGVQAFVLTVAGCIGVNGMNNQRVGICCNTLMQLRNCRDGLPVACIVRGVLAQRSDADAASFLQRIKHASGQNYILGGPVEVATWECSATKAVKHQPLDAVVWHTNHPYANDDYGDKHKEWLAKQPKDRRPTGTEIRLQTLERRLTEKPSGSRLDLIKSILVSKDPPTNPICISRGRGAVFTFAATIMVLSDAPEFHVAPGPPDVTPYQKLTFTQPQEKP